MYAYACCELDCKCMFVCFCAPKHIQLIRSSGHPSSEPRMLCSALVVTYLSETKMDVSVRLLKHAFSPGRHSSGGNRFLAEIDRTEKRKQHPHLGPTSRTWLLALSWVFLLRFFNCCLLLLLIATYSPARQSWLESLITFNTHPLISNNCVIKWALHIYAFLLSASSKTAQFSQHFKFFSVSWLVC